MNTTRDDTTKLWLNSSEIIEVSEPMAMMFEVEDRAPHRRRRHTAFRAICTDQVRAARRRQAKPTIDPTIDQQRIDQ